MNAENSLILAAGLLVVAAVAWYIIERRSAGSTSSSSYLNEQIYVGNLPYHISEDDLRTYFSRYGVAHSVRIIRNFKTGRSKGYAFVTYNSAVQAKAALAAHGKDLEGRAMVVRIAKPRQGE